MKWLAFSLMILIVTTVFLWVRASMNEVSTQIAYPPLGQAVEVDGKRLQVSVSGTGPPVVLIHGASGTMRDMSFRLTPVLEDRYTVIAVDRPGLGYSPANNPDGDSLAEQTDLMADVMTKLGYERYYLLGQSFGGSVALRWALDRPDAVAGLVLVAAPSNPWKGGLGTLYKLNINPVLGPVMRLLISSVLPRRVARSSLAEIYAPQEITPGYIEFTGLGLSLRRGQQKANALQVAALKPQIREMAPRYGEIKVPVQAIHGTADTIVPYTVHTAILADQIEDIEVTVLDGEGHMPHQTQPGVIAAALDRLHAKVGVADAPETGE
jgi:pimeloyl-ACP methyl ester carboxylesterase